MKNRNQLIQLIHIAKSQLALDDDTYRVMLLNLTDKDSCKSMSIKELESVISDMENRGFKRVLKNGKTASKKRMSPKSGKAKFAEIDKIRAIWITMAKQGFVRDGSETALDAYVRRMTKRNQNEGVDHVNWCNDRQAYAVLEALKSWHRRVMVDGLKARAWPIPMNKTGSAPSSYEFIATAYSNMLLLDRNYKNHPPMTAIEFLQRHTNKSREWCTKYLNIYCKGWNQDGYIKP
jgi:phage gp16-like protein